jgi:hypothetical protein
MEATPNAAAVTPEGVRDGEPAALRGLVARRGPAVVAFCTEILGPEAAPRAAAEALARFRAAVHAAGDLGALDPDALLRGAARHAAAAMVHAPPPSGRLRRRDTQCAHVPTLLAARAGGRLGAADQERLARHLQRCDRCRALAESFRRAEIAYGDAPDEPLPGRTSALLLAALESAAPVAGAAEEPPPAAAAPDAADTAAADAPPAAEEAPAAEPAPPAAEEPPAAQEPPAADDEPPPVAEPPEAPPPAQEPPAADDEPPPVEEPAEAPPPAEPPPPPEPPPTEPLHLDEINARDVDAPVAEHPSDRGLGETVEWDTLPEVAPEYHGPLDGDLIGGGRERRSGVSRGARIGVPVAIVAAGVAGALALAGVFGGDDGTPAKQHTQTTVTR